MKKQHKFHFSFSGRVVTLLQLGLIGLIVLMGPMGLIGCKEATDKWLPRSDEKDPTELIPGLKDSPDDSDFEQEPGGNDSSITTIPNKYQNFVDMFANVAEQVVPGVVSIRSQYEISSQDGGQGLFEYFFGMPQQSPNAPQRREGLGSGVLISPAGYILTNNHVIEDATQLTVQLNDLREYEAELVGADKPSDLAVIRIIDNKDDLPVVKMGNSDKLRIGEWVMAVGNPFGLSHTVTTGIISAKGRQTRPNASDTYENFLQTDAAINPGNSGGALVNLRGELIGINTAIFSRSGGYQGIGFAIPINMAKKITEDLIRDGEVSRGWLGVSIQSVDKNIAEALALPDNKGALVNEVFDDSPAEKGGLKRGDVIRFINEFEIKDANDLINKVALVEPGTETRVIVLRDGKKKTLKIDVGKRDQEKLSSARQGAQKSHSDKYGLQVMELTPELKQQYQVDEKIIFGVMVVNVEPNSAASEARLKPGDIILEVNKEKIKELDDYKIAMKDAKKGKNILLLVNRQGDTFHTAIQNN